MCLFLASHKLKAAIWSQNLDIIRYMIRTGEGSPSELESLKKAEEIGYN